MSAAAEGVPAGFWRRYLAGSFDWLLLSPLLAWLAGGRLVAAWQQLRGLDALLEDWVLEQMLAADSPLPSPLAMTYALLQDAGLRAAAEAAVARALAAVSAALAITLALAALYFIGFEASRWSATPGKRLLRLRVEDLQGRRLRLPRATLRFLAGGLSWLSLNLGHALAGWRADGRALHDLIAGSRVLARGALPGFGRGWAALQLLVLVAVLLGLCGQLLWLLWQARQAGVL